MNDKRLLLVTVIVAMVIHCKGMIKNTLFAKIWNSVLQ